MSKSKISFHLNFFIIVAFELTSYTHLIDNKTLKKSSVAAVPPGLANLPNLEILNLANNQIEELPLSLSSMPKLRILNLSINRLYNLPRGFGAFPVLEVLDLTYNNLNEKSLPGNFFMMGTVFFIKKSY